VKAAALPFWGFTLIVLACAPATAQQITGVPGSPSATTTIDGRQIPPPPQKFEGEIERNAAQSKPYWLPKVNGGAGVSQTTVAKVFATLAAGDPSLTQLAQNHFENGLRITADDGRLLGGSRRNPISWQGKRSV
jgi:hypothetical protein